MTHLIYLKLFQEKTLLNKTSYGDIFSIRLFFETHKQVAFQQRGGRRTIIPSLYQTTIISKDADDEGGGDRW